jgi:hypothetical protein
LPNALASSQTPFASDSNVGSTTVESSSQDSTFRNEQTMEQDSVMSATDADAQNARHSTQPEPKRLGSDLVIDSMETMSLRMLDAFWCLTNNSMTITSPDRMREVLRLVANEVETWAPPYTEHKICHLAVTEVAQRLRAEADA